MQWEDVKTSWSGNPFEVSKQVVNDTNQQEEDGEYEAGMHLGVKSILIFGVVLF